MYNETIWKSNIVKQFQIDRNERLKNHNAAWIISKLYCKKKEHFYCIWLTDDANKEQLHSEIQQFLASNDLNIKTVPFLPDAVSMFGNWKIEF